MLSEIYSLAESGQFDNDIIDDSPSNEENIILDKKITNNNENKVFSTQEILDDDDCEDYNLDDIDEFDIEFDKIQSKGRNQDYINWAEQMDLKVKKKSKDTDKSDNATYDRVLDDRSLKIMYEMMRNNLFMLKGNISAGKEANVYYAPTSSGEDLVVKVYMTSIMPFKARDKYMNGDFRFRNSNTSSSTKLVTAWAEKEFRNLMRISETNGIIPCPKPVKQKGMVLVMSMIGKDGEAAPKLKDVNLDSDEEWSHLYEQILGYVRILFQECRLIHADLSEYNLLYHDDKIWMIDVSQSVEHFHPEALNFLRKDCHTMNTFFRGKGIKTLSLKEFFDFVVDPNLPTHRDENFSDFIRETVDKSDYCVNNEEDTFFLKRHIARCLGEVNNEEKDYRQLRRDPQYVEDCPYASVSGMKDELKEIRLRLKKSVKTQKNTLKLLKLKLDIEENEEAAETAEETEENEVKVDKNMFERQPQETKDEKKQRKKLVKDSQREKRIINKQIELEDKKKRIQGVKSKRSK